MAPGVPSRILILVPHPDDEVVGCCAAIGRARAAGSELFALYLTSGIAPAHLQWPWRRARQSRRIRRRRDEALRVAERLDIHPLEFADRPARTLKDHLAEVRGRIWQAVAAQQIDTIWTPAYEGGHQDHDITNRLASTLAGEARVLEFAEYNFRDGSLRSHEFATPSRDDLLLALTAEERALKAELLALYASERGNLGHVRIDRERFRPLYRYDYARPPHAPPLFYQRFQWIPFHHPRVDFTSPGEICAAMTAFGVRAP